MNADAILGAVVTIMAIPSLTDTERYDKLTELGSYIAALDHLSQGRIRNALVEGGWSKTDAKGFLSDCVKTLRLQAPTTKAIVTDRPQSWPYDEDGGRLVLLSERAHDDGAVEVKAVPIADFTAAITEEGTTEDGRKIYTVAGEAVRSGWFAVDIDAEDFSDDRKLKAALEAAAGARDPVRAGMMKHLGPAIKLMTNGDLRHTRRFMRTGWNDDKFLIPGREAEDVTIRLPRKLPYRIDPDADLAKGLECLDALIQFMGPQVGTVVMSHLFLAPLAALAGWRNERTGVFIRGRTGTHKSSAAQVAMCLYGPEFMLDDRLIKWGEGATRNAIMTYASSAHDLPFLVDNYKPTTGGGAHDFTNLIHNIMEGGDKERLTRSAQLRETRVIHTWPLFTGEDVPNNDPASLARILIAASHTGRDTTLLTIAQELAPHLCAVGGSWVGWLETEDGRKAAVDVGKELTATRLNWFEAIRKRDSKTVNPMRVATNLSTNWLSWLTVQQHPAIGELALRYANDHVDGLQAIMEDMAKLTTQALEANRFIDALRETVAAGRALIIRDRSIAPNTLADQRDRDRFIGWEDGAGYYLLPDMTLSLLQRATGLDLGGVSKQTLYDQLDELGVIASKGKDQTTKLIKNNGKPVRVLHLTIEALQQDDAVTESSVTGN